MKKLIMLGILGLLLAACSGSAQASTTPHGYAYRQACHNEGWGWYYRYTFLVDGRLLSDPLFPDTICLAPYGRGHGGHGGHVGR